MSNSIWDLPQGCAEKEILKRVELLQLEARKHAITIMRGNYRTKLPGKGLEFMEARKYVTGESIREIDWSITARMNEPYVRVFHEERERDVYLALDISPSMHYGWQDHRKIEYAVEIAASLAYSVTSSRDRLGLISYSDKIHDFIPPRRGEAAFLQIIKTCYKRAITDAAYCRESDMRQVIHRLQAMRGKRFTVFFLSDFIDYDFPDDLRYLKRSHDVSLIHLYDPFEHLHSSPLAFTAYSPERNRNPRWMKSSPVSLDRVQNFLKRESLKYGIVFSSLDTSKTVRENLHHIELGRGSSE